MEDKNNTKYLNIYAWLIFGLLGYLAFREFLDINILAYVSPENLLHSHRFLVFLLSSFISLSLWIGFFFLILRKEWKFTFPLLNNIPPFFKYIISGLLILLPALLKWVIPLPENFNLEVWAMVFLFYSFSLLAVFFRKEKGSNQQRLLWLGVYFMLCCLSIYNILVRREPVL